MSYVLIIMSAFTISGFTDIKECQDAADIVRRQIGRNMDAAALCVPRPNGGEVIGRGERSKRDLNVQ